ncbi:MAG: thiamine phosphate synthase [Candidatus Binatia bacterium]
MSEKAKTGFRLPPLYPIVNVADAGKAAVEAALALAVELAGAGATLLQLRAKSLGAGAMMELASRIVASIDGTGALLVVNDRADVAAASGAAGVHVGDEDLPPRAARATFAAAGPRAVPVIVGYSTHSVDEAVAASLSGDADYLGFGPVFESPTKSGVRDARGLELLAEACRRSRLPVVAIGGITLETAPLCWKAGAASVAVISEIERSRDRSALLADYRRAAEAYS